ncbi:MAG: hypothetical protein P4L43_20345 [Syntrophobacteraceae bacterium]|nr:hypothetical protein [Syntrophobacteraceae bacterium]
MKKIACILIIAISLAGGAVAVISAPSYAQGYNYPAPPPNPDESPWVGLNTPWFYYNGDWFLNGVLYYYYGPNYGWAPYYAYSPDHIVRPQSWYAPNWMAWYQGQPQYRQSFERQYPYWREHRQGQRYSEKFFEQHNHGQGVGWQKGFQSSRAAAPSRPEGHKPGPAQALPPEGQHPGGQREPQRQKQQPGVQHQQQRQQKQPQKQGGAREKEQGHGHGQ